MCGLDAASDRCGVRPRSDPNGASSRTAWGRLSSLGVRPRAEPPYLISTKALERMVVDDANGLHPCVHDRGAHELETPSFQVLGNLSGQRSLGRNRPSVTPQYFPFGERPAVLPKVFSAVAHLAEHSGAGNGRFDLGARPDDGRVPEESFDVPAGEPGDGIGIEAFECLSRGFTLAKDDRLRQPGLKPFEHEHFPQRARVALRNAPLLIVIRLHERVLSSPTAT